MWILKKMDYKVRKSAKSVKKRGFHSIGATKFTIFVGQECHNSRYFWGKTFFRNKGPYKVGDKFHVCGPILVGEM